MAFLISKINWYGGSGGCGQPSGCDDSQYFWWPNQGGSRITGHWDWIYDALDLGYRIVLGRRGEFGGMTYWYNAFVTHSGTSYVGSSAAASSYTHSPFWWVSTHAGPELSCISQYGAHTGMAVGTCAIIGCMDPLANNTNYQATQPCSGCCTYNYGCTDGSAWNHDPQAVIDDGSCVYRGCMDTSANNFCTNCTISNPAACTYNQPTVSLNRNPGSIIRGQSSTLSWSTNYANSGTISVINYSISPVSSGSRTVSPTSTTTYTLSVQGNGNTSASNSTTVTVYTPPTTSISVSPTTIPSNGQATLTWNTSGDASTAVISPSIGVSNPPLSSQQNVSPTSTTTWTITVTGLGGTASDSCTLTVLDPPTCSITASPNPLPFGGNITINYSSSNSTSLTLTPIYNISSANSSDATDTTMPTVTLLVNQSGTYTDTIDWTTYDGNPILNSVKYTITATGSGGTDVKSSGVIPTATDRTPDLIVIPDSGPLPPETEPVTSPKLDPMTSGLLVDDIDVPVEITANKPIKVDIDSSGNWQSVKQS